MAAQGGLYFIYNAVIGKAMILRIHIGGYIYFVVYVLIEYARTDCNSFYAHCVLFLCTVHFMFCNDMNAANLIRLFFFTITHIFTFNLTLFCFNNDDIIKKIRRFK